MGNDYARRLVAVVFFIPFPFVFDNHINFLHFHPTSFVLFLFCKIANIQILWCLRSSWMIHKDDVHKDESREGLGECFAQYNGQEFKEMSINATRKQFPTQ